MQVGQKPLNHRGKPGKPGGVKNVLVRFPRFAARFRNLGGFNNNRR
jgi:hypothetical protein